ncbi:glycosyltransferase family 4 protein [Microbacterium sp. Au-Mic1]|uniref:glycosyltransferase family 4 protein n=1 Tax=Microbacterium sp. Au-Mic1 TaxID=2906457 RepID=UPI001E63422E|nr:glycosyltransferase family 4 protein [Microbacterium sp. Au-Mic1]MCE4027305.1 glycosyltransferase family 4 protein [Microbacterium sp. Au-Mic1]
MARARALHGSTGRGAMRASTASSPSQSAVLWLSVEVPDRFGQGGQRRQYHQIAALREHGRRIVVVSPAGPQDDSSIAALTEVIRPRLHVKGRAVPGAARRLARLVRSPRWEAIVLSHQDSVWLLPEGVGAPVLLDVHNAMSAWLLTRGLPDQAAQHRQLEARAITRAEGVITCSDTERIRLIEQHPDAAPRVFTAPLGIDPAEWPDRAYSRSAPLVALFGGWAWEPNRRGLDWFLGEVWPLLAALAPDARCRIAGTGLDGAVALPAGVEFVGKVPSLVDFTAEATVVAVPVIDGVGAAMKFAEALATGAAVIATPDAASAFPGSHAEVSADPAAWAAWIADRLAHRDSEPAPAPERAQVLAERTWAECVAPIERWLQAHGRAEPGTGSGAEPGTGSGTGPRTGSGAEPGSAPRGGSVDPPPGQEAT